MLGSSMFKQAVRAATAAAANPKTMGDAAGITADDGLLSYSPKPVLPVLKADTAVTAPVLNAAPVLHAAEPTKAGLRPVTSTLNATVQVNLKRAGDDSNELRLGAGRATGPVKLALTTVPDGRFFGAAVTDDELRAAWFKVHGVDATPADLAILRADEAREGPNFRAWLASWAAHGTTTPDTVKLTRAARPVNPTTLGRRLPAIVPPTPLAPVGMTLNTAPVEAPDGVQSPIPEWAPLGLGALLLLLL